VLASRILPACLLIFGFAALTVAQDPKPGEKKDAQPPAGEKKDDKKKDDGKKDEGKKDVQPPEKKDDKKPDDKKDASKPDDKKDASTGGVTFMTKFELNKPIYMKMTTSVKQTIKVQGGGEPTQAHTQTFYFKWTPEKQDGDKWIVKLTIEGAALDLNIGGNPVKYDSTAPETAATSNPALADYFRKLIGSELKVTFDKVMAVEKVDGRDDLLAKLQNVNPQMEAVLRKILTEEALKQMADPSLGLSVAGEKKPNDSWEKKTSLSLGPIGSYEVTTKYTYKGKNTDGADAAEKDLDLIEVTSTLVYKAPTEQADGLLFRIKGGTLETVDPKPGKILFNTKAGRIAKANLMIKMKGTLNVTVGGQDTSVDLTQEQTTDVLTSDTSFTAPKK
jgi:hypothetical protein